MGTVTNYERYGVQVRVFTYPARDAHKLGAACRVDVPELTAALGDSYNLSSALSESRTSERGAR